MPDLFDKWPWWITRFIGAHSYNKKPLPLWRTCIWAFLGAFVGIAIVEIIFTYSSYFRVQHNVPMIIASCGASAILVYGAIESPLAQPRNVLGGTLVASIIGVAINQMFLHINTPEDAVEHVRWVAGATSVAITLVLMLALKCVHPPAGATTIIPIAIKEAGDLGWYYIGVMMLSLTIMVVIAMIINNIDRRYPTFWWTPTPAPASLPSPVAAATVSDPAGLEVTLTDEEQQKRRTPSISSSETRYYIPDPASLPDGILDPEEHEVLKRIYQKLQQ
ncbi:hypothetical protein K492DRAFT_233563 [Lichtheimia hyalospora FSU 10163]|nr:hypothetical protein K492DRAFT_233563 [Lichtheimia hyalospora FSU 10163]